MEPPLRCCLCGSDLSNRMITGLNCEHHVCCNCMCQVVFDMKDCPKCMTKINKTITFFNKC